MEVSKVSEFYSKSRSLIRFAGHISSTIFDHIFAHMNTVRTPTSFTTIAEIGYNTRTLRIEKYGVVLSIETMTSFIFRSIANIYATSIPNTAKVPS
jgi:hypothetical protein